MDKAERDLHIQNIIEYIPLYLTEICRTLRTEQLCDIPPRVIHCQPIAGFLFRPEEPSHPDDNLYIWAGTYTTKPGKRDEVITALKEFSPVVEDSEPETLSYVVLKALGDEYQDVVCLWERYTKESALRNIHAKSEEAAKLKDKISPLLADRSLNGYRQVGGFLTKNSGLDVEN